MSGVLIIGNEVQISREIGDALSAANLQVDYAHGHIDALQRLRSRCFDIIITNPESTLGEDLAMLDEMRTIRPGVRCVVLAHHGTPAEVIAALRARVFACFTPPFSPREIVHMILSAAEDTGWQHDIHILSARPEWISLQVNCRQITAERLMTFAKELNAQLPENTQLDMMQALREILLNAMEHGGAYNPDLVVELFAVRTARSLVFYLRDPGVGFHRDSLQHAAIGNPPGTAAHVLLREKQGMRPGGYGILMASGSVDELIYNEIGNEVILIKYTDSLSESNHHP